MNLLLSSLLGAAMLMAASLQPALSSELSVPRFSPPWLQSVPSLPSPQGEVLQVRTAAQLLEAVERIQTGGTILLADGHYKIPRTIVLRHKTNITVASASMDPEKVTLAAAGWESGGSPADILHIGPCEQVTVAGISFTDARTYAIKVEAEHAPKNIHIYNCHFSNIGVRAIKGSASQDPNLRAARGSVRFCQFENTRVPPADWLFGGDYIGGIDMMALDDWEFSDNLFRNIKGRNGAGRAAVFIWVRSRQITIERNVIIDCDRGIAFGNPGRSTADLSGQPTIHVRGGIIRNNFIAGGPDGAIELWQAQRIRILNNSIWRPERNWNRGIRVGEGTRDTEIVNNLVHGQIQFEGGHGQLIQNLTRRLDGYFENPEAGNLALTALADDAIDKGKPLPELTDDIRRQTRVGSPDIGAWEFAAED
jgi:hypothetical protein